MAAPPGITGSLALTAVSATGLPDGRMVTTMCPSISIECGQVRNATQPCKGGGTKPTWNYYLATLDLSNENPATLVVLNVIDEKKVIATASLSIGELIHRTEQAKSIGQKHVRVLLQSAKGKAGKGEVVLSSEWTPRGIPPQQQQQPPPMMQQQSIMQQAPQQPIYQPVQQQPLQQQQTFYQPQQQPGFAPQVPIMQQPGFAPQPGYAPQPSYSPQPGYAPQQQVAYYPNSAQPMMVSPPASMYPPQQQPAYAPMQQPMQSIQQQPYGYPAAQPQLSNQPFYPGQQPIQPMAMASAPAPWSPETSSDDGTFPFSELTITRLIGEGTFGTVSAGEFRSTPVAIKQLKQTQFTQAQWNEFMSEVKFLREARHPNLVLFMGVSLHPYSIVTELLDTSLFDILYQKRVQLSPAQKVHIALGVARGLASLHARPVPIVHRDIKSLNILVSKDLVSVKICDLGMVKLKAQYGQRLESNGTPNWMSPECLLDQPYDERTDIYSFGCVLFELTTSQVPFGAITKEELVQRVGRQGERPPLPPNLEPYWRDLLIRCWQQHPLSRPSMKEIVAIIAAIQV